MSNVLLEKKSLRERCKALRLAISPEEKAAADAAILHTVTAHSSFLDADLLLCFFPVRGEVDLTPITEIAKKRGVPVAFPRCEGTDMRFHTVENLDELAAGRFGIPTPRATAPLAFPTERTLCLLPGLAAGRDGSRLGYGGGFYDRFLDTFGGITLFPIYERLVFPTLPTEKTDRSVDHLITEKGEIPLHV